MKRNLALTVALSAALLTVGCASSGSKSQPIARPASSDSGISTAGAGSSSVGSGSQIDPNAGALANSLSNKTVYFAYDSSDIDATGEAVVNNFGRYLTATPAAKVRLEGNTDERGSAEYNIALGERRAQAVARELKSQGVSDSQLSVVSYGKERPAVQGHDEAAYAKNRRVEINQQ